MRRKLYGAGGLIAAAFLLAAGCGQSAATSPAADTPRQALLRFYELCSGEKQHDVSAVFSDAEKYKEEIAATVAFNRALLRFQSAVNQKFGPGAWDQYTDLQTKVSVNLKGPPAERAWYEKAEIKTTSPETAEVEFDTINAQLHLLKKPQAWLIDLSKDWPEDANKRHAMIRFLKKAAASCDIGTGLCKENLSLADLKQKVSEVYMRTP